MSNACPVANSRHTDLSSIEIPPQFAIHEIVEFLRRATFVELVRIDILVQGEDVKTVLHVARRVYAELQDRPGVIHGAISAHEAIFPGAKDSQKLKQSPCEDLVVSLLLFGRLGNEVRSAAITWKLDAQPDMLYHPPPVVHDPAKISDAGVVQDEPTEVLGLNVCLPFTRNCRAGAQVTASCAGPEYLIQNHVPDFRGEGRPVRHCIEDVDLRCSRVCSRAMEEM